MAPVPTELGRDHVTVLAPVDVRTSGRPSRTAELRMARIDFSFWAAAAMVVSIAASPSQPCCLAPASRSTRCESPPVVEAVLGQPEGVGIWRPVVEGAGVRGAG